MFRFNKKNTVSAGPRQYMKAPTWNHSDHVLPLLAAMENADEEGSFVI